MAEAGSEAGLDMPLDNTGLDGHVATSKSDLPEAPVLDEETKQQAEEAREAVLGTRGDYDPTKKANLDDARLHGQARKVLNLSKYSQKDESDIQKDMIDQETGMPADAEHFPFCVDLEDLQELGPGIPLYYYFVKYTMLVLAFGFFVAGIACWQSNVAAGNADDWGDDADDNFIINMSIGAHGQGDGKVPGWQAILHVVVMVVIIFSYYFLRRYQINKDDQIDKCETTASDYTLWVQGLGQKFTEKEVEEFFTNYGLPTDDTVEIKRVNIPYEISDYVDWIREHTALKEKLQYIEDYMKDHDGVRPKQTTFFCCKKSYPPKEELEKEIADVWVNIQKWQDDQEVGVGEDLLIGQVFLTCNKQIDVRAMDEYWGGDWVKRFWDYILIKLGRCCFCCKKERSKPEFQGDKKLIVQIAPEPNDIFYENLGLPFAKRVKRRVITWLVVLLALGISFGIIYGSSFYQNEAYRDYRDKDEEDRTNEDLQLTRVASILPGLGIVIVNTALQIAIRLLTSNERLQTVTEYNSNVALRLTVAQTINTAVIVIAVNYDFEEHWFVPGGLAVDVFWIMIITAFVQPIAYLADPWYIRRRCRQWRAPYNEYLTQGEANALFEGPPLDLARRYSNIMKSFILALVYAPLLPVSFLIAFVGMLLEYCVDKYLLLNRHARPARMSSDLSDTITKLIPWVVFFYALMLFIFNSVLESDGAFPAFVWMWICLVHLFLPIDTCRRLCSKTQLHHFEDEEEFEKAAVKFFDDYDRANPATEDQGWQYYESLISKDDASKGLADKFKGLVAEKINVTPGNVQAIGKTMLQQNIANYANQRQTMNQTFARLNNTSAYYNQRRQTRPQVPQYAQAQHHQQMRYMIMNQQNQARGQKFYQNYTNYGVSAARNPYMYPSFQAPMQYMAQSVYPAQAYQHTQATPHHNTAAVYPSLQPPAPAVQHVQYATQPAVAQQAYYQAPPGQVPQQYNPGMQPQAHPGVVQQPYSGAVQQPGMQPGYQQGFQQPAAQYPPAQYQNQPPQQPSYYR